MLTGCCNWSYSHRSEAFAGQLLSAGIAGVKAVDPSIKIMMHIDTGGTNSTTTWWIAGVHKQGVSFDVLGLSCYTAYADQGPPANWQSNFSSLVTQYPNLSFAMAEYAEGAPDISGHLNIWRQANDIVFNLPNKKGLGTFLFEPTFTASWDQPLLDFTSGNDVTPLADPLKSGSARIQEYDQTKTAYGL